MLVNFNARKVITMLTFVIVVAGGLYLQKQSQDKVELQKIISLPTPNPVKTVTGYKLTLPSGETIALRETDSKFVKWQDWLVVGNGYYSNQVVYAMNINDGTVKKIYENDNTLQGISDLAIVDNKLLISIGGYMAGGGLYSLNLPPESKAAKLITVSANGEIIKLDEEYWLQEGEGDACWGYSYFRLIDPKTMKITPVAEQGQDCEENGTTLLALNYNQSAIMADKIGSTFVNTEGIVETQVSYTTIYQVKYDSPKYKRQLLKLTTMPTMVTSVEFDKSNKQIVLRSLNETYLFNIEKRLTTKVDNFVLNPTPTLLPTYLSKITIKDILPHLLKIPGIEVKPIYN